MKPFTSALALAALLMTAAASPRSRSGRPLSFSQTSASEILQFDSDPDFTLPKLSNELVQSEDVQGRHSNQGRFRAGEEEKTRKTSNKFRDALLNRKKANNEINSRNNVGPTVVEIEPYNPELVNPPPPEGHVCMKKTMKVEEYVYEDIQKCTHATTVRCMNTWVTVMEVSNKEKCDHSYEKVCHTSFELVPRSIKQTTCSPHYERDCNAGDNHESLFDNPEQTCTTEEDVMCTTKYIEYTVDEDETNCVDIQDEQVCVPDPINLGQQVCSSPPPRQRCEVTTVQRTKTMPNVECEKVVMEVCGAVACPLTKKDDICKDEIVETTFNRPVETCSLQPQRECKMVPVHTPRLMEQESCQEVPFDSCRWEKGNPQLQESTQTRIWCGPPNNLENGPSLCLKNQVVARPGEDNLVVEIPNVPTGRDCRERCNDNIDCDYFNYYGRFGVGEDSSLARKCQLFSFESGTSSVAEIETESKSLGLLSGEKDCVIVSSDRCDQDVRYIDFDTPAADDATYTVLFRDESLAGEDCANQCLGFKGYAPCDAFSWDYQQNLCTLVMFNTDPVNNGLADLESINSEGSLSGNVGCTIPERELTRENFDITVSSTKEPFAQHNPLNVIDGELEMQDVTFEGAWLPATVGSGEWIVIDLKHSYPIAEIGFTALNIFHLRDLEVRIGNTEPDALAGELSERTENTFCQRIGQSRSTSNLNNYYRYHCQEEGSSVDKVVQGRYVSIQRKTDPDYEWPIFEIDFYMDSGAKI